MCTTPEREFGITSAPEMYKRDQEEKMVLLSRGRGRMTSIDLASGGSRPEGGLNNLQEATPSYFSAHPIANTMGGDHKCPVCQATFTRPQHVARHMRSRKFPMLTCAPPNDPSSSANLVLSPDTGDRPYKCQYCGDQFARRYVAF